MHRYCRPAWCVIAIAICSCAVGCGPLGGSGNFGALVRSDTELDRDIYLTSVVPLSPTTRLFKVERPALAVAEIGEPAPPDFIIDRLPRRIGPFARVDAVAGGKRYLTTYFSNIHVSTMPTTQEMEDARRKEKEAERRHRHEQLRKTLDALCSDLKRQNYDWLLLYSRSSHEEHRTTIFTYTIFLVIPAFIFPTDVYDAKGLSSVIVIDLHTNAIIWQGTLTDNRTDLGPFLGRQYERTLEWLHSDLSYKLIKRFVKDVNTHQLPSN